MSKGLIQSVDSYSGFGSHPEKTELHDFLQENGVTEIYCVGLAHDYCVGLTAVDGAKHGYKTYVVTDATRHVTEDSVEVMKK